MKAASLALAAVLAVTLVLPAHPAGMTQGQTGGHPAGACSTPYHVSGAGWDVCWQQDNPRVQGLELARLFFQGEPVAWRVGVPFTLTQYETPFIGPFKDTLGTPGAGGHPGYGLGALAIPDAACPRFLPEGALLNNGRLCVEHRGGPEPALALWARFNIYNYRFMQGWMLDGRGHIEPMIGMGGLLIDGSNIGAAGNNHYHHLYWRIDLDVAGEGNDVFQSFHRAAGGAQFGGAPINLPGCSPQGLGAATAWCDVPTEAKFVRDPLTHAKWRVKDADDTNAMGRARSYEVEVLSHASASHFSSTDVMVVQYKGDSTEIGYEVPTSPYEGDARLLAYVAPPEPVDDPVVWVVQHMYHDTRDEDRGSMSYHYAGFDMRPNNFFASNPGEDTYP